MRFIQHIYRNLDLNLIMALDLEEALAYQRSYFKSQIEKGKSLNFASKRDLKYNIKYLHY